MDLRTAILAFFTTVGLATPTFAAVTPLPGPRISTKEGCHYGLGLLALNADGVVWDKALIGHYLADPSTFVRAKTGDNLLPSGMAFKLRKGADVAGHLASVVPAR